jgi:hypothetical protein
MPEGVEVVGTSRLVREERAVADRVAMDDRGTEYHPQMVSLILEVAEAAVMQLIVELAVPGL